MQRNTILGVVLSAAVLLGLLAALPLMAHETPSQFATNTPSGPPPATTPDAPSASYALRLWLERDLLDVLFEQLRLVQEHDPETYRAVQLTQFELESRFPGAPRDPALRDRLLGLMLLAPRGSVDMRALVRTFVLDTLNADPDAQTLFADGFSITVQEIRLDADETPDALVEIRYPAGAADVDLLYHDYLPLLRNASGVYRLLPGVEQIPAAPFAGITSLELYGVTDATRDRIDEVVLLVTDQQVNRRMLILGYRAGSITELTLPGQQIRFGQIIGWGTEEDPAAPLRVLHYRLDSARWGCISELALSWSYSSNFFRSSTDMNATYSTPRTLGCALHAAEPLFAMPPAEAITLIEDTRMMFPPASGPVQERLILTLAMLYALNGQPTQAMATANSLEPAPDSWAARQRDTMLAALGSSGSTALDICAQLVRADPDPVCDMDAALGQILRSAQLPVGSDLQSQLAALGLEVLERVTISEVGRVDRTAFSFALPGTGWWAFIPRGSGGTYLAEPIPTPPGFEAAALPPDLLRPSTLAYNALLVDRDPATTLTVLDNIVRANPGVPFSPEGQFLRALALDLSGARADARTAYYELWSRFPLSVWGRLAGHHLERR